MHRIEITKADTIFPIELTLGTEPFTYDPVSPGDVAVSILIPGAGVITPAFTINSVNAYGLHELFITENELPSNETKFILQIASPTQKFNSVILDVHVVSQTIESKLDSIISSISDLSTNETNNTNSILTKLNDLLASSEYNFERTIEWDETGTKINAINISFVKDDQAVDFSNPDKKYRVEYTRDNTGKVTKVVTREVSI